MTTVDSITPEERGLAVAALPIIGAVKASDGSYYRYPLVGLER